ncbi:MAG: hypothetical protein WCP97_04040 [bacterium]
MEIRAHGRSREQLRQRYWTDVAKHREYVPAEYAWKLASDKHDERLKMGIGFWETDVTAQRNRTVFVAAIVGALEVFSTNGLSGITSLGGGCFIGGFLGVALMVEVCKSKAERKRMDTINREK